MNVVFFLVLVFALIGVTIFVAQNVLSNPNPSIFMVFLFVFLVVIFFSTIAIGILEYFFPNSKLAKKIKKVLEDIVDSIYFI